MSKKTKINLISKYWFLELKLNIFEPDMKKYLILSFSLLALMAFTEGNTVYKVIYKINYITNLTSKNIKTEIGILMIEGGEKSSYCSENTYKQDSILQLVNENKLNANAVMNDKYPKTAFKNFIEKKYSNQNLCVSNVIFKNCFIYNQTNNLNWTLHKDTIKVQNYICNKATVSFEGRDYTAWYTPEIPISDGPYKFWGLPGLILKVYDSENHYTFTMESFERHTENSYKYPFKNKKNIEVSYEQFKVISKENNENPLKVMEENGFKVTSIGGQEPSSQLNKRKNNPIEKY